jgi:fatty acid desaturase
MRFARYKANHVTHHIYTGDEEKDLGFSNIAFYELDIPLEILVVKRHFLRLFTVQMFKDYLGYVIYDSTAPLAWRIARIAWLTGLVTTSIYSGPGGIITFLILAYILAARIIALPAIGYLSDILDHGGMLGHKADLEKSRNYVVKNRLMAEAFFPRNDCYHLIHHLFPTVPAKWMPAAHAMLIRESTEYRGMTHSFIDWMKIAFTPRPATAQ